jgi:HlyD family secretion protein
MTRPRIALIVIALLALAGWFAYRQWTQRRPFEWSGTVEARTIAVGSRVGGRVKEVLVVEGAQVDAGQALVVLESGDWSAQQALARAQLAQARAQCDKLEHGARPEEIDEALARAKAAEAALAKARTGARKEAVAAAAARVRAAESALERAQIDRDRAEALFAKQAITQENRDHAALAFQETRARLEGERQQLAELENGSRPEDIQQAEAELARATAIAKALQTGSRAEDIAAARAQVDAAAARVEQIGVAIAELTVRSPAPARIEALDLRPGDIIAANATAAVLLEDAQLFVRIYVPETQLGHIAIGQRLPITVDSFPGVEFEGIVEYINDVGEFSPRNLQTADERANQVFATRVTVAPDARSRLRAGMAALVRVHP